MFNNPTGFEPSSLTKFYMSFVRTKPQMMGSIPHPGLYGIHGYTMDTLLIFLVLIAEIIGAYLIYDLMSDRGIPFWTAIVAAAVLVIVDIAFAVLHHYYHEGKTKILKLSNIIIGSHAGDQYRATTNNEEEIGRREKLAFLMGFILVVLALVKIGLFLAMGDSASKSANDWAGAGLGSVAGLATSSGHNTQLTTYLIFIAVLYLFVAWVHVRVTGYWASAVLSNWLFNKDEKAFRSDSRSNIAIVRVEELGDEDEFFEKAATGWGHPRHKINKEDKTGTPKGYVYLLESHGLIMDEEILAALPLFVHNEAKNRFVITAMKLQVQGH